MPLAGPHVQQAQALAFGLDLGMLFQKQWTSTLWPFSRTSDTAPTAAAAKSYASEGDSCSGNDSRRGRPGVDAGMAASAGGPSVRKALQKIAKLPLLPAASLALAACGAVAVAVSTSSTLLRWLAAYAAAELSFQGWQAWRYTICNVCPEALPDAARVPIIKERFLRLAGVLDIRMFMSGWFHGAPFETIRRGNALDFIAYGFYSATYSQLTPEQQCSSHTFIDRVEAAWGVRFPEGDNPDISPMLHLWEPLRVLPKPLVVHLVSEACGYFTRLLLWRQGYVRSRQAGFAFWVRPSRAAAAQKPHATGQEQLGAHARGGSANKQAAGSSGDQAAGSTGQEPRPLVFLHGVGWGLMPYLHFVRMLASAAPHHPVVLVEARHIALRICGRATTVDDLAHATAAVLKLHKFEDACFVGHSYGTFAASRIRQLYPEMVHSLALLDPVCLMTCSPQLLANFVYRRPRLTTHDGRFTLGVALDMLRFACSRDLMIASAFCRRFHWHELMLWPEDMPEDATVVMLSRHDDLVPLKLVQAQLAAAGSGARVLVHPTAAHGGFLVDMPFQRRVVSEVQRLLVATEGQL